MCGVGVLVYLFASAVAVLGNNGTGPTPTEGLEEKKNHTLTLAILAPFPKEGYEIGWKGGCAFVPAVKIAMDEVNSRPDILPNYELKWIISPSGCNIESITLISFLRDVVYSRQGTVVGVIGPGCSDSLLLTDPLANQKSISIIQVSLANSPVFAIDRKSDSYTLTILSSSVQYIDAIKEMIRTANWTKVALLYEVERDNFKALHGKFTSSEEIDTSLIYTSAITDNLIPISDIMDSKSRVVFVFSGSNLASRVLCLAYLKEMLSSKQWVFVGRTRGNLNKSVHFVFDGCEKSVCNCTAHDMERATLHVTYIHMLLERYDSDTELVSQTTLGVFRDKYDREMEEYVRETNESCEASHWGPLIYDATWSWAVSLNSSLSDLEARGLSLEDYHTKDFNGSDTITRILMDNFFKESNHFEGATGTVRYSQTTGDGSTSIVFDQGNVSCVGIYNPITGKSNFTKDAYFIPELGSDYSFVSFAAAGVVLVVTFVALVLTVMFHLMNTLFDDYKSIKATSPGLNHLAFSGCYLFIIALVLFTLNNVHFYSDRTTLHGVLCNLTYWSLSIGFTMVFGILCMKTWRIYRIFTHFQSPGVFVSDLSLVCIMVVLVAIDVAMLTSWSLTSPLVVKQEVIPTAADEKDLFRCHCHSSWMVEWVGGMAAYKGIILVTLVVLSILTRHVHHQEYRQTKSINILVYMLSGLFGVGLPMYILLDRNLSINVHVPYLILCFVLVSTLYLCIGLILYPPTIPVWKDLYAKLKSMNQK